LLVTYGAADAMGETSAALAAIGSLHSEIARAIAGIDVVVGPLDRKENEIRRLADALDAAVHIAPAGLASLMRSADLVLTAGGNSLVEALSLRKPCLVTVTADNQEIMVRQLVDEGVIRRTHRGRLAADLKELLADLDGVAARIASHPVFDHLGAERVADAMLEAR
jgi:UDP-2,4-diacetamido-2,4,6-trideoxy-beta-L-altropyranose hydrolase